jgi:hypothetical protein
VLLFIIAAATAAVAIIGIAHRRAVRESDLGWVTERWLTEYRADQSADSK